MVWEQAHYKPAYDDTKSEIYASLHNTKLFTLIYKLTLVY